MLFFPHAEVAKGSFDPFHVIPHAAVVGLFSLRLGVALVSTHPPAKGQAAIPGTIRIWFRFPCVRV